VGDPPPPPEEEEEELFLFHFLTDAQEQLMLEAGKQEETCEERARVAVARERMLEVGGEVEIHSLTGSAEHNGERGVLKRFDQKRGRWDVCITTGLIRHTGKLLALKPQNLTLQVSSCL
jgi:hypothetical protein